MYSVTANVKSLIALMLVLIGIAPAWGATNTWEAASPLATARYYHTATLLSSFPGQQVLVVGGFGPGDNALASAEVYDLASNTWFAASPLANARGEHTTTLLRSGKVLVTGGIGGPTYPSIGSELYDPASDRWNAAGAPLENVRFHHTATLLPSGEVLVVGGVNGSGFSIASAERYSPASDAWNAAHALTRARYGHTATLLSSGKVLVVGGTNSSGYLTSAELYDPANDTWSDAGLLNSKRADHSATLLPSGRVLVVGGSDGQNTLASAELYDPTSNTWSLAGSMAVSHVGQNAALLPSGKVLIVGGSNSVRLARAELYDPANNTWSVAGSMATARAEFASTLLPSGALLAIGGYGPLASCELYDSANSAWLTTGSQATARYHHVAAPLPSGQVLVVGGDDTTANYLASAELYTPATGTWSTTGSLAAPRDAHTASLLTSGKVLVAGGYNSNFGGSYLGSTELYDPSAHAWTSSASLNTARGHHTATLLASGKVLVVGGDGNVVNARYLATAELYDPAADTWSFTGSLVSKRDAHTATLLPSGRILVAGGYNSASGYLASAELYDPITGNWSSTGSMASARGHHTATLLPSGKVLVSGGTAALGNGGALASAELYDPSTGMWSTAGSLVSKRYFHTATLVPSGKVLVAGGTSGFALGSAELYDPVSNTWAAAGALATGRDFHTATLLPSGQILMAAGFSTNALASAELFGPGLANDSTRTPNLLDVNDYLLTSSALMAGANGSSTSASGATIATGFTPFLEASGGAGNASSPSNAPVFQVQRLDNDQMRFVSNDESTSWTDTMFFGSNRTFTGFPAGPVQVRVWVNGVPSASLYTSFAVAPGLVDVPAAVGGNLQASVTFSAPDENGGAPITRYTATAFPGGAQASCTAPCSNIVFVGIAAGNYVFQITATNAAGMGPPSPPSNNVGVTNFHTVTPSVTGNGSISPNTAQTVNHGAPTSFTVTPNTGNHLVNVTGSCGGSLVGNTYTTNAIIADCSVIANFAVNTHIVTPSVTGNGSITPNTAQTVNDGATKNFTVTPNPNNHLVNVTGSCGGSLVGNTFTTNAITTDCTVIANFAVTTHTITPSVTGNGSISPNTAQTVNDGTTSSFTVTPNAGNYLVNVTGSCGGSLVGNTYTTNAITSDCTVIANFAVTTHTVTPSVVGNGSISPSTAQIVNDGATTTFTVTPNAGSSMVVTGTCGGSLVGNTYTTNAISADCTVIANFAVTTHTVTPSVTGNGSISPSTAQTVNNGDPIQFILTPNAGNHLVNVAGSCGGSLVGNTYTTNAITADCTVVANFAGNVLVFMTQPADMPLGMEMGTIVVAEEDGNGNTIADDATVDFAISNVCGGTLDMGSVAMNNGVATLTSTQRFYTVANGMTITASTPGMSSAGAAFNVIQNSDLAFASGFDGCRP